MSKQIIFSQEARNKVLKGIEKSANAVKVTLGPRGRNVVLASERGSRITNDGDSIAKDIELKDPIENIGAQLVKEVAGKTNGLAGDGTTTTVVLFEELAKTGMRYTDSGVNVMELRAGMDLAKDAAVAELKKMAKPVSGKEDIERVATISAESKELGKIIAETIEAVGKDGVVTVEEGKGTSMEYEIVEGLEIDAGYSSPYMVTNSDRMEAEMSDAPILITDKKISSVQEILPLLEKIAQSGKKELVLIADDIQGDALATFVVNKLRGAFSVLAIKAPGFGTQKKELLADLALTTGGHVISEDTGDTFESATLEMFGRAGKVIAKKDSTVFVDGAGEKSDINAQIEQLKTALESAESKFEKEGLEKRIAKLSGGVAVIRVGASTETEMKYLKDKIDDAVLATKSAMDEGIVPGGGSALARVATLIAGGSKKLPNDRASGYDAVVSALQKPLKQIAMNAGKGDGSVIAYRLQESEGMSGYDAMKDEIVEDMITAGIIDPVKVTRGAVQHGISAASILLTTEAVVVEEPEESKEKAPVMPGMGM